MSRFRAFFSFDAALAAFFAALLFSLFSTLLAGFVKMAFEEAKGIEGELLSLRFSSYVIESGEGIGAQSHGAHRAIGELDLDRLEGLDLELLARQMGKDYAAFWIFDENEGLLLASSWGKPNGEVFCARRIVLVSGEICRLEACIS